jgi:hypothetical protein
LLLGAVSSSAQTADQPATRELTEEQQTIKALVQEVQELKSRIAALEARQAREEAAPPTTQQAQTPPANVQAEPQTPASQKGIFETIPGMKFQGFGSITYKASNANPPQLGATQGFRFGSSGSFSVGVGDLNLFLTSQLTAKTSVLAEITFAEQNNGEFVSEVERLLVRYNANDYFKPSAGRFHTATSYYNKVFHHGLWLQTAADRPLIVEFSDHGGLIPSQAIGTSITGRIPSGKLGLNYIFEYGTPNTTRPQVTTPFAGAVVFNNGNETTAGFFVRPDWVQGLEIGGSFYHDRFSPAIGASGGEGSGGEGGEGGDEHFGQSIYSAHVVYVTPRFEFLNEGFLVRHKQEGTGEIFNTPSFYSQISRKFGERWRPYFRYQYINASTGSPVFPDIGLRHGPSGGLRVELNDYVALKTQFDYTFLRLPGFTDFGDVLVQLAFRF